MEKFTIKDFEAKFPDEAACLEYMFQKRFGNLEECPHCNKKTKFYRVSGRKCYACPFCSYQLHPLADTIFHKSSTSLKDWFRAIYLFSNSKNGVSGKELQRHLGVTYKTAWRMAKQIRQLMQNQDQDGEMLCSIVEADETYVGGYRRGKPGRGVDKTPVIGIVERGGEVKAIVSTDTKSATIIPFICENVKPGTQMMTDEYRSYNRISLNGFTHQRVNHSAREYVAGIVHTNTIEGFWSQLKRSVNGTYHSVSPKYLQSYVNEFAYRYNRRQHPEHLFHALASTAARLV